MQLVRQFVSDSEDIHEIEQLEKLIEAKKKTAAKIICLCSSSLKALPV
jgi:hypothetical protein